MREPVFKGNLRGNFSQSTHVFWLISIPKTPYMSSLRVQAIGTRGHKEDVQSLK